MTTAQRNTWFWVAGFALFFLALWLLSAMIAGQRTSHSCSQGITTAPRLCGAHRVA